MAKKIQSGTKYNHEIDKVDKEAKEHGLSYGKYVLKQYLQKEKEKNDKNRKR